ncbi:hydrolase [Brevibacterium sp.]|uniref:hydrolase n=1 Tax=Brevibacterium sp. TaxID=1701 RepID=UPI00281172BB|nr:hydrolase [Brevibacterium sp.]
MTRLTNVTICRTCGVEFAQPTPPVCPICEDERQFVPSGGQVWTSRDGLEAEGHSVIVKEREPGLFALHVEPRFGIGQTCYLAQTEHGNLLFDVPSFIDAEAIAAIGDLGGVSAIAPSHPHMFGVQLEWSAAFDDAPIYVCSPDSEWLQRRGEAIVSYVDVVEALPGVRLQRVGGHFLGSAIALWTGADGNGVMLSGDSIGPVARDGWVTFMRSFPNYLPLSATVVRRIAASVADLDFDRMYGNFGQQIPEGAHRAVQESAERYAEWVSGVHDDLA